MAATDRGGRPARLLAHARFLGAWGHLLAAGAPEASALQALAEDTADPDLRELARAGALAAGRLGPVLDAHGGCLDAWLSSLLAGRRRPEGLIGAASLLEREARAGWSRGLMWAKLDLLATADAPLGDALSALAREVRDHELGPLAEGLYGAARRARGGAALLEALAGLSGTGPLERAALASVRAETLSACLRALEGLAGLPAAGEPAPAASSAAGSAPASAGPSSLSNLAQAATAGAAPLRRGIERVLSGIEGALGIGPAEPTASAAQLAREAVQSRAARSAPPPTPPSSPPPATPSRAPEAEPGGKKKTIGMDSGPVPIAGFEAGKSLAGEAHPLDAPPADPTIGWTRNIEAARSKLALAELHPDQRDLAAEVERDLARLRATIPEGNRRLSTALDDLELRLLAWKERNPPG